MKMNTWRIKISTQSLTCSQEEDDDEEEDEKKRKRR